MKNKTCGECKHFEVDVVAATCEKKLWICDDNTPACKKFEPKVITNGDVVRQGGNRALAEFQSKLPCEVCAYANTSCYAPTGRPSDCKSGILAWLNAPACVKQTIQKARLTMANDRLHIICGNCGHDATDENFTWGYRPKEDYGNGEFDPADVFIHCKNCGTLHALGKYMQEESEVSNG